MLIMKYYFKLFALFLCSFWHCPKKNQKGLGNSMRGIPCFPAQSLRTPAEFPGHRTIKTEFKLLKIRIL